MEAVFWASVFGVLYPYLGYPLVLWVWAGIRGRSGRAAEKTPFYPTVSMIIPVHNEEARIERKMSNTAALYYPDGRVEILFVSDGSTDKTVDVIRSRSTPAMTVVELPIRRGKAAALNAGLERARHEVVVFSDASIDLEPYALDRIVQQFRDPQVGCISGEDRIPESGGEAWYGRYELFLRRLESEVHSIVGASGSFYAQRRALSGPFGEGMAPDFLSVLHTIEKGFRAVTEPTAVGTMTSVKDSKQEFRRKVRTLIRGMTTLFAYPRLLTPWRFGVIAFELISHKLMRWLVPFALIGALVIPLGLLDSPFYRAVLAVQVAFYLMACCAFLRVARVDRSLVGKAALYFSTVNAAIVVAWIQYARGVRQELWTPSQR